MGETVNEMKSDSMSAEVHFVPQWPGNPYHAELAGHLPEAGFHVSPEDRLKAISRKIAATGKLPKVVHLHAIPRFELSWFVASRFAMFLYRLHSLRRRGVRVVWTIHDIYHHESLFPRVELMISRMLFKWVDATIVHSEAAGKAVEKKWGVKRDRRCSVIPHGNYIGSYPNSVSAADARTKLGVPHGKLVFLFLGMIRPYKGVLELIETFKRIADGNVHLLIAGKPISDELADGIVAAIGERSDIQHHLDHVADAEMQDYLNAADMVLFPYTRALTSGALILAMSFGRACIAPKMGALEDTLDESGGFLYDPEDANGLRDAMQRALAERAKLDAMGENNLRRAKEWDWGMVARMTADVYNRCLSNGSRS